MSKNAMRERLARDVAASDGPKPDLDDWLGASDAEEDRRVPETGNERVKPIDMPDGGEALARAIEKETATEA